MGGFDITINLQQEGKRFLPRYLAIQLIELIANTVPTEDNAEDKQSKKAKSFIKKYKELSEGLFTDITSKIFWREPITELAEYDILILNDPDKYMSTPLNIALANEDFALAHNLIQAGAELYLDDKVVLEITLFNMLQRNPDLLSQIISNTTEDNREWVNEYLEFLSEYLNNAPSNESIMFRDVFSPPIRIFGQVLETPTYFDGTPSYYGFLGPSLDILSKHLTYHTNDLSGTPELQEVFKSISDSYNQLFSKANYFANLPKNNGIAEFLLKRYHENQVVLILGGWAGNAVTLALYKKYLIMTNLGPGGDPNAGTKIYNIEDPEAINLESLTVFTSGLVGGISPELYLSYVAEIVSPTPAHLIEQSLTPIDNCIFANPRAIIQGMLQVLLAEKYELPQKEISSLDQEVKQFYKNYTNSLHLYSSADLVSFMRNNLMLRHNRIECCSLALEYINTHCDPEDDSSVALCIHLRNALEFVGLGAYFNHHTSPEIKAAMQRITISEQERTAVDVIHKEQQSLAG